MEVCRARRVATQRGRRARHGRSLRRAGAEPSRCCAGACSGRVQQARRRLAGPIEDAGVPRRAGAKAAIGPCASWRAAVDESGWFAPGMTTSVCLPGTRSKLYGNTPTIGSRSSWMRAGRRSRGQRSGRRRNGWRTPQVRACPGGVLRGPVALTRRRFFVVAQMRRLRRRPVCWLRRPAGRWRSAAQEARRQALSMLAVLAAVIYLSVFSLYPRKSPPTS